MRAGSRGEEALWCGAASGGEEVACSAREAAETSQTEQRQHHPPYAPEKLSATRKRQHSRAMEARRLRCVLRVKFSTGSHGNLT